MRSSRYCLVVSIVCGLFLSTLVHSGSALSAVAVRPNQRGTSVGPPLDGFYFGTSKGELGERAWFLQLDFRTHRGQLHMPPGNLELRHVKISEPDRITFRSATDIGDLIYQFEGHLRTNGIVGRFDLSRATPGGEKVFATAPVVLEKVDLPSNNWRRDITGVYSNVEYNSEGGDLTGEELILFWSRNKLRGVFTPYESDMSPYATVDVVLSGTNLRFRVLTQSGEESYQGVFSRDRLKLRRTGVDVDPEASQMVLFKKRGGIRSIFEKRTVSRRG
jgi:hypothetical protein